MVEQLVSLPFFEVKRGLTTDRKTMATSPDVQELSKVRLKFMLEGLQNTQILFREIAKSPKILSSIPGFAGRNIELFNRAEVESVDCPTTSDISRVDVVGGKIVDINMKPSGLGLVSSAEVNWRNKGIYQDNNPVNMNYNKILPATFNRVVVVTESEYPFASDQIAFAKLGQEQTGKPWNVVFCDQKEPKIKSGDAVFCFSWLSSPEISKKWIDCLFKNQEIFLLNPLAGKWDNKAFMALPFLDINLRPNKLGGLLFKSKKMFPKTYLFQRKADKLEMAVELNTNGVEFQSVNKFNAPKGTFYLKPLLESGARGVVVRKFRDGGTSKDTLARYSERYGSFVAQARVRPENINGYSIKDGYFVSFNEQAELLTIERMGVRGEATLIHGGSSSLIPVSTK